MSFNSWDKLVKARRDFPKTKFATAVVDKALKKAPSNVYLLAWKVDLLLALDRPKDALERLQIISSLPGVTDARLLEYLYTSSAESIRRSDLDPNGISSIGAQLLKPWQAAAKSAERKADRMLIWDTLFTVACREDCWDDVQAAVINYQKEGLSDKKHIHYTRILVVHLAAEQKRDRLQKDDKMTQVQFMVARGQMKQAFLAPPNDPIAITDIRDLRFMAEIYARQGHCTELFELWDNAPESLAALMETYHDELMNLKARILDREKEWKLLEKHCTKVINDAAAADSTKTPESKNLSDISSSRWNIWRSLLRAVKNLHTGDESVDVLEKLMKTVEESGITKGCRPNQRLSLILSQAMGAPLLPSAKIFWDDHSSTPSCFNDLRVTVENLQPGAQQDFHQYIQDQTRTKYLGMKLGQVQHWEQAELNVLKFDYLLTLSLSPWSTDHAKEALIAKTIRFCITNPGSTEGAFVAIYALLHLHYESVDRDRSKAGYEVAPKTRVLLQATMLARKMVAIDSDKENRTLALLAARLHLNLGLGKSAFALYIHCKLKEMLLDTLSPIILSRISMTHPFDIKGYQGFSADEELAKVIGAIDRMEHKTDTTLYTNVPSFIYDQAPDVLLLKRQLKGSLTRQLCLVERRRIARLRGKPTDQIPRVSHRTFEHISDNRDTSVFPDYGSAMTKGPYMLVMPAGVPSEPWIVTHSVDLERVSNMIYREDGYTDNQRWYEKLLKDPELHHRAGYVSAEFIIQDLWGNLRRLVMKARVGVKTSVESDLAEFPASVVSMRKAMQSLRLPETTTMEPEDEPTMFSENMLLACYTTLEVLRATNKLLDILRETVVNAKSSHDMKSQIPNGWVDQVAKETQLCFKAVQDVAQSYISVLKKRGLTAIKAQVRWGVTGDILRQLLSDDDVEYYANEYLESAIESWSGVLKVMLK